MDGTNEYKGFSGFHREIKENLMEVMMEKNSSGTNPFGVSTRLDIREAAVAGKEEAKQPDFVGIFLGAVPALEKSREALEKISESLADSDVCEKCNDWCERIRTLEVEIMESAIGAVRGDVVSRGLEGLEETPAESPVEAPAEEASITPGMISGREDIPKALLSR